MKKFVKKHFPQRKVVKCIVMMKMVVALILVSILSVAAGNAKSYSQVTKMDLILQNASLENVIWNIKKQTKFNFFYNSQDVKDIKSINVEFEDATVEEILVTVLENTGLTFDIVHNTIIIRKDYRIKSRSFELLEKQQPDRKTITGIITGTDGKPIPGITVVVEGTTVGTTTDDAGKFSLTIPDNARTLLISFVGMKSQQIPIDGKTELKIVMEEDMIGMEEVIVVGYGTQKKINLTGSVDAVSGEELQNRTAPKVADLIKGTSPNLNISMDSYGGEPGANSSWNIRGIGTIHGSADPLVLVDGVEMNINNVDPETIESISILKDASASAIYGARAPFGVVLITTKTGKRNEKISIQYNNNISAAAPIKLPHYADALTWATAYNQANANAGLSPVYPDEQMERIKAYMEGTFPYEYDPEHPISGVFNGRREGNANYDWPDELYADFSFSQKHNINVTGGDEKTQYYVSGGISNQNGLYNYGYDYYKRYNFLANFSSQVTDWLSFNSSIKYAKNKTDYPLGQTKNASRQYTYGFIVFGPMMPKYNINGTYQCPQIRLLQDSGRDKTETNDFFITIGSEIEPLKGWKTNISYSHNLIGSRNSINPKPVLVELGTGKFGNIGKPDYSYESAFSNTSYKLYNILSSYEKTIGDHYLKILAGYEQEDKFYSGLEASAVGLITGEVPSISTALGSTTVDDRLWHWATQGVFGRLNYNYKEKYLLEFSARYNGSSRFAEDSRWGLFPSASAGYNLSKENFWIPLIQYINLFKIRGSYGSLGNQNVNNYLYLSRIPVNIETNWIIDRERPPYAESPSLISDDLTWETITTLNLGFDAAFLNSRLGLVFDWYDRITTNMLGPTETLPYILGANTPQTNNAELSTKGFELVLNWSDRPTTDFSYDVKISLGDNKSTILKYKNEKGLIDTWYEGKVVGEIWGFVTDGIMQTSADVENMPDQTKYFSKWEPGDIKYKDLNGDNIINDGTRTLDDHGDLKVIGNDSPRYNFGITGGFKWKGVDFHMFWHGIGKRDYWTGYNAPLFWGFLNSPLSSHLGRDSWSLDYWRPADETNILGPNTDAYFPKPYFSNEIRKNQQPQTRYLLNPVFIRLKNLQLGYTILQRFSKKLFLQNARIYISAENVLTLSKMPDNLDPEIALAASQLGQTYPLSTNFSIGFNLTF